MTKVCPLCGTIYDDPALSFCPSDGTRLSEIQDANSLIGHLLAGRFRIVELLGQGGMGAVYKAVQESVDREVAIKILRREAAGNSVAIKRFLIEAKATSSLSNDHTITVFDHGQTPEGLLYIAMEYLEGITLRDKLFHSGALPYAVAVKIIDQVAESLAEAHQLDIIHRDLKPENIFLAVRPSDPEFVKVLDFGIARAREFSDGQNLTKTGTVTGTPTYMSPEAVTGQTVNAAADVYAMGVIFHEMLTGSAPFNAETPFLVMQQHVTFEPPTLVEVLSADVVPHLLSNFVQRCLSKTPGNRPSDGAAFRRGLELALSGSETSPSITTFDQGQADQMMGDTLTAAPALVLAPETAMQHTPSPEAMLQHDTIADTTSVLALTPSRRPRWLGLVGAALLVFSLGGAWALGLFEGAPPPEASKRGDDALGTSKPTPAASSPVTAPAPSPTTAPSEGVEVSIMVDTTPRGAELKRDGAVLGQTPFQLQIPRGDVPIALEISLAGFEGRTIEVLPVKSGHRRVELKPLASQTRKAKPRRSRGERPSTKRRSKSKSSRSKNDQHIDDYLD